MLRQPSGQGLAVRSDGVPPPSRRPQAVPVIGSALVLLLAAIGYLVFGGGQAQRDPRGSPAAARMPGRHWRRGHPAGHRSGGHSRHHRGHRGPAPAAAAGGHHRPAAALQESQLQNLDYGDRDSVGVFQQRPSQGWGTTAEIEDPVYATTRFFAALVKVPGYTKMPVDQAAQDVQHSADGYAYEQWVGIATQLTGYFTGTFPAEVSCWYTPAGQGVQADLAGALKQLTATFGPARQGRSAGEDDHGPFGQKNREESSRARAAGRGLDGGRLAGGARPAVWHQPDPVCRLRVECREWQYGLATGPRHSRRTASPVPRGSIVAAYEVTLTRHEPTSRHTVLAAGIRTTKELTRDLHHRAALR